MVERSSSEAPESRLRAAVAADEDVLALGRAQLEASNQRKRAYVRGSFLIVTDRRILWTDGRHENALLFDDVSSGSEQTDHHRLWLTLRHRPIEMVATVPGYHVWFIAGGNATRSLPFTETTVLFSRAETKAVVSIREQLTGRGVPVLSVPPVDHPPREERIAATSSPYVLVARPRLIEFRRRRFKRRLARRDPR